MLEATFPAGKLEPTFIKLNARPKIPLKEQVYNPDNPTWESITTTFIDVPSSDQNWPLWKILASVYEFSKPPVDGVIKPPPESVSGELKLKFLCPKFDNMFSRNEIEHWEEIEEWTLKNVWPILINFGELDYSTSDQYNIEITWRYNEIVYKNMSPVVTGSPNAT
jgi:hypothetical protein